MKILGIETSCDETAVAVVEDGTNVLSSIIASQIPLHHATGGIVPEVAAREHVVKIMPTLEQALNEATLTLDDIDAIAVTQGPGLLSSLVIGVTAASTLALVKKKPLIPVNHIAGHIYANWLNEESKDPVTFPILVLTVSGGHNELVYMKSHAEYTLLGETLDDAAGEAFDKVARILGLGYPGGPPVSHAAENGNPQKYDLPRAYLDKESYDFSFSGLKTAVLNLVKEQHEKEGALSDQFIADCAASFQEAVCEVLVDKLLRAAKEHNVKEVHLAGGVSANTRLREMAGAKCGQDFQLRYAHNLSFCTDNAAMIAAAAFFHSQKKPEAYFVPFNGRLKHTSVTTFTPCVLADPNLRMYHNAQL